MKTVLLSCLVLLASVTSSLASHIYVASWEWHEGVDGELSHWQAPGGDSIGLVDLRSLVQMGKLGGVPEGTGVFVYSTTKVILRSIYLGQDLNAALTVAQLAELRTVWELPALTSVTVRDALWDRLTIHTDPTGLTGPKPLRGRRGEPVKLTLGEFRVVREEQFNAIHRQRAIEVWMNDYRNVRNKVPLTVRQRQTGRFMLDMFGRTNNQLAAMVLPPEYIDDGWRQPETTITDDFNRGDSDSLGDNWTERQGDWDIVSSKMKHISSSGTANVAHHNTATSSADYYVEFGAVNLATNLQHRGPCLRRVDFSTADSDCYTVLLTNKGSDFRFYKRVSGSWTLLNTRNVTYITATDYMLKIQANGTSHSTWFDGTLEHDEFSDSALSAIGDGGALEGTQLDDTWDDFTAEDLVAGSARTISIGGLFLDGSTQVRLAG